jgi:hypothetical protein
MMGHPIEVAESGRLKADSDFPNAILIAEVEDSCPLRNFA